ncbi:hypothetical protein [Indioceanicola profundi]|uniref:hypothetical protein n=1 Tax=Indioceanicola profundi TaxID=2220096 RepID=UPI0013C3F7BC|nr:hypothetical protein [Indioceanicola profundi]
MADQPRKVGVYDTDGTSTAPKTDVKVERTETGGSKTLWWVIGLIILAVIVALLVF